MNVLCAFVFLLFLYMILGVSDCVFVCVSRCVCVCVVVNVFV